MARRNEHVLDQILVGLATLPWWVSVVVSAIVYVAFSIILPSIISENPNIKGIAVGLALIAPYLAFLFLIPAPFSAWNAWRKRQLLDNQTGIRSIRALSWKQFEELVGEAYRRKGYRVVENHTLGADGGVDVRLEKDGFMHLVQCKHWKTQKVGVSTIREMFGLMTAEKAAGVIVITSGNFTQDAKEFARDKPIGLIDGEQLVALIGQAPSSIRYNRAEQANSLMHCPRCGNGLVLRTAKKGKNVGNRFYGCSSFPKCRYTHAA